MFTHTHNFIFLCVPLEIETTNSMSTRTPSLATPCKCCVHFFLRPLIGQHGFTVRAVSPPLGLAYSQEHLHFFMSYAFSSGQRLVFFLENSGGNPVFKNTHRTCGRGQRRVLIGQRKRSHKCQLALSVYEL